MRACYIINDDTQFATVRSESGAILGTITTPRIYPRDLHWYISNRNGEGVYKSTRRPLRAEVAKLLCPN
jgi:hypothetical protein